MTSPPDQGTEVHDVAPETSANVSASPTAPTSCRFEELLLDDSPSHRSWRCPHPVERDGLCIFHLPKVPLADRSNLSQTDLSVAEQLDTDCRKALADLIAKTEQGSAATAHEFIGFNVPPGFGLTSIKLQKRLNFRLARFQGDAGFAQCEVAAADFRDAEFLGRASFYYVEFHDSALFNNVHFHGIADFGSVKFRGRTIFAGSQFREGCSFRFDDGGFDDFANFNRVAFHGRATFDGFADEPVFHGLAGFCGLSFSSEASLSFANLTLAKADFYDTDLGLVRFIGTHWNTLNNRPALWGEVRLLKIDHDPVARKKHGIHDWDAPPQPEKLAENYAQLVLKAEERRDVDAAEAFHIGEMEMRRRRVASGIRWPWLKAIRENLNGFAVYRLSSVYGTSYTRAAVVLTCIVLLVALLFLWTGIAPVASVPSEKAPLQSAAPIKYQLFPDNDHPRVAPSEWLEDYIKALSFTLSIATFQKDRSFQAASRASDFLAAAAVIVIGAQAALLLFAVRRRFKR